MWLLLVSPAQPTENKTHAECNDINVKAYDPEAPFHLQRIISDLLKATKARGNSSMFKTYRVSTYTKIQNSLKNKSNEGPHFIAEWKLLCFWLPATAISFVSIFVTSISVLTAITHHMACGMFSPSHTQVKLFHHGMSARWLKQLFIFFN